MQGVDGHRPRDRRRPAARAPGRGIDARQLGQPRLDILPRGLLAAPGAVADGLCQRGIVLGGSGNGEAMVANRIRGVRCSLCWDLRSARLARQHNDANVLSLGQRMLAIEEALEIVQLWLATPFDGGRHQARIDKIDA